MKRIALFGATGTIGQRILNEAVARGHQVTAIVRNTAKAPEKRANLEVKVGDALDPASVATAIAGSEVVVASIGPRPGDPPDWLSLAARSLIEGVSSANKKAPHPMRLIVVGGAGSLEVAPGLQLVDSPQFPPAWKPVALAARDSLAIYRKAAIDWTYASPAALIQPGTRTGTYRTGTEQLVTDSKGESRISAEDYAVAIIDEIEKPQFVRRRFTAAY